MQKGILSRAALLATMTVFLTACGGSGGAGGSGSTVEGVDSERRGYRDDVKQFILDQYSSNPAAKKRGGGCCESFQTSITAAVPNQADTSGVVLAAVQSSACAADAAGPANIDAVVEAVNRVYARTFNIPERLAARKKFTHAAKNAAC